MRLSRLRGRKVCENVLRKGMVWRGKTMHVRFLLGTPRHPHADPRVPSVYIGTIASSKLDKSAVKRNRMRRRVREAWRIVLQQYEFTEMENHRNAVGGSAGTHRGSDTIEGKDGSWKGNRRLPFHAMQLLIAPRSSSLKAPFEEIQRDVSHFLSSRPWPTPRNEGTASSSSR